MYNIDSKSDSTFVPFTPGIKENCVLENVKFEPADKEGLREKVLRFSFKGPNGEKHIETIFQINKENTLKMAASWGRIGEEVLKEEVETLSGKLMHIMSVYIPKVNTYIKADSWEDFAAKIIAALGTTFVNVPIRMKLVLNTKDYLQLPKKAKAPFIQKMSEPCTLSINPKYDNVVYKPKAAVVADPFATNMIQSNEAFGTPPPSPSTTPTGDAFAF